MFTDVPIIENFPIFVEALITALSLIIVPSPIKTSSLTIAVGEIIVGKV